MAPKLSRCHTHPSPHKRLCRRLSSCWEANLQGGDCHEIEVGRCACRCRSALALGVGGAKAATITETINFTASGFQPAGAPVDPVMGSFTITLDPTVDTSFATTITFNNVSITPGANAPFFFYVANSSGGSLTVCSPAFPASCGETAGFNAFDVRMVNFQSTPTFFDLTYAQSSVNNIFSTTTGSVSVASVPAPWSVLACRV